MGGIPTFPSGISPFLAMQIVDSWLGIDLKLLNTCIESFFVQTLVLEKIENFWKVDFQKR